MLQLLNGNLLVSVNVNIKLMGFWRENSFAIKIFSFNMLFLSRSWSKWVWGPFNILVVSWSLESIDNDCTTENSLCLNLIWSLNYSRHWPLWSRLRSLGLGCKGRFEATHCSKSWWDIVHMVWFFTIWKHCWDRFVLLARQLWGFLSIL